MWRSCRDATERDTVGTVDYTNSYASWLNLRSSCRCKPCVLHFQFIATQSKSIHPHYSLRLLNCKALQGLMFRSFKKSILSCATVRGGVITFCFRNLCKLSTGDKDDWKQFSPVSVGFQPFLTPLEDVFPLLYQRRKCQRPWKNAVLKTS